MYRKEEWARAVIKQDTERIPCAEKKFDEPKQVENEKTEGINTFKGLRKFTRSLASDLFEELDVENIVPKEVQSPVFSLSKMVAPSTLEFVVIMEDGMEEMVDVFTTDGPERILLALDRDPSRYMLLDCNDRQVHVLTDLDDYTLKLALI